MGIKVVLSLQMYFIRVITERWRPWRSQHYMTYKCVRAHFYNPNTREGRKEGQTFKSSLATWKIQS